jgi:hypothetical protein
MQSDVWGTVNASEFHTLPVVIFQSANTINGYVIYGHNRHKLFNHTVLLYQRMV